jgi:hypothetical protein
MIDEILTQINIHSPQENIIFQFELGFLSYSQAEKRIRILTPNIDECEYWITELQIQSDTIKYQTLSN